MMKEVEDLEPGPGTGDEEDAKEEGELDDEVVQLDEKGCLGRCCSRHCCWVFMKWPWVATAAVVLLITGLVMWGADGRTPGRVEGRPGCACVGCIGLTPSPSRHCTNVRRPSQPPRPPPR